MDHYLWRQAVAQVHIQAQQRLLLLSKVFLLGLLDFYLVILGLFSNKHDLLPLNLVDRWLFTLDRHSRYGDWVVVEEALVRLPLFPKGIALLYLLIYVALRGAGCRRGVLERKHEELLVAQLWSLGEVSNCVVASKE